MKHQIEKYNQQIQAHLDAIAELKKKEETSEWVPKAEFHRLNEEYTELEKELEAKEGKIKILAGELMQLKKQLKPAEPKAKPEPQAKPEPETKAKPELQTKPTPEVEPKPEQPIKEEKETKDNAG
jgi:uncharacterized protein YdcH (DUF465 family)